MKTNVLELYTVTSRKAKYGHRDWLYWIDKNGDPHAELKTESALNKLIEVIREIGDNGTFRIFNANCGTPMRVTADIAQIMLNNINYGF